MSYANAKLNALKILGKEAKFPKTPGDLAKDEALVKKGIEEVSKSREDFERALLGLKKALSAHINTAQACSDVIEGSDFGLDGKQDDAKAKIAKATKILSDELDATMKFDTKTLSVCEDTFKTVASMAKAFDKL